MKLVKQIVVASAVAEGAANDAFVRVEKVDYKPTLKAKIRIHMQTPEGATEKSITVKKGDDLATRSEGRASYQDGYQIAAINAEPGNEHIQFNNGKILRLGEEFGSVREDVWRVQIKQTVKRHLENELNLHARGIKVLSLFFLDKVANYRVYGDDGAVGKGPFADTFEAILAEFAKDPHYASLP